MEESFSCLRFLAHECTCVYTKLKAPESCISIKFANRNGFKSLINLLTVISVQIIWYPLFGQLYVLANHLRIDRSNPTAAIESMKEVHRIFHASSSAIDSNDVLIFLIVLVILRQLVQL